MRFISKHRSRRCLQSQGTITDSNCPSLSVYESNMAETYWLKMSKECKFDQEMTILENGGIISKGPLVALNPIIDSDGLLRVGGQLQNSKLPSKYIHLIIIYGNHPVTKLIAHSEHLRLLHAGSTLLHSSLNLRFHIIGIRKKFYLSLVLVSSADD